MSTNGNFLKVSGDHIINQKGETIYLRGFGLGGMLHMENFIDGYPANEDLQTLTSPEHPYFTSSCPVLAT